LLDCLDWKPNRDACIDACLSGHVTRNFRLDDYVNVGIKKGLNKLLKHFTAFVLSAEHKKRLWNSTYTGTVLR